MIREAEIKDIPALYDMAVALHDQTVFKEIAPISPVDLLGSLQGFVQSRALLVEGRPPVAMFAFTRIPMFFNKSIKGVQEMFWYVRPDRRGMGLRFLREVETWVRNDGAMFLCVAGAEGLDPRLDMFYRRAGYRLVETHYVKRF